MTDTQKHQAACRMYYLDGMAVKEIAADLQISRDAVRAAVNDPAAQEEYLQMVETVRRRLEIRKKFAVEKAFERQMRLLQEDTESGSKREQLQQLTAERILRRNRDEERQQAQNNTVKLVIEGDGMQLGMPGRKGKRKGNDKSKEV